MTASVTCHSVQLPGGACRHTSGKKALWTGSRGPANRSARSAPALRADSAKRRQRLLEKASVERTDERLRIVPDELWHRVEARQKLRFRDLGVRVRTGLRKRRNKTKYLLSGWLRCDACRAAFALSNGTRYQCASHHDGGNDACSVSLSVPREQIERVFMDYMASPELPRQLTEIAGRRE